MQTIEKFNFAGKKAFVRVDFNVPVDENFAITDDTRIRAAMPTLKKILADGGSLIIASHMGRPKKNPDEKYSLKHIVAHVSKLLGTEVKFVSDCNKADEECANLKPGEALLLENLRFYAEEEGKPRGLAEDATDEEVIAAAKAAYADHFITTLPGGYNMELNEDASNVSQGQKQLLTIARAILANNPVLILDEATSSIDTRTEQRIQKAMDNLMKGRTSFIIAHRLSTIKDADMILVMKDGDIVEQGTHDQLLEKGGFYADLYNSQFENA